MPEAVRETVLAGVGAKSRSVIDDAEADVHGEVDRSVEVVPNDPEYGKHWGLRNVCAPEAWALSKGSPQVVIAIVDTGANPVHDLAGKLLPGWNVMATAADTTDTHGPGTRSASGAAAETDNATAVAGYCWDCRLLRVTVADDTSSIPMPNVASGTVLAADNGADVNSSSISSANSSSTTLNAVRYALERGANVVTSAGNLGSDEARYAAGYPEVVGVAGSTSSDRLDSWCNHGTWGDVAAPGSNLVVRHDGSIQTYSGTSSATPADAGVLGPARAHGASAIQARRALQRGAPPVASIAYGASMPGGRRTC